VILEVPRDGPIRAFMRWTDNDTLRFRTTDTASIDGEGNRWSYDGTAFEGPHEGAQLDRLEPHGFLWFIWSRLHPETGVYDPSNSRQTGTE